MTTAKPPRRLTDLPLWRLLVLLDDAERTIGADSQTARTIARIVKEKLRAEGQEAGENGNGEENAQTT